MKREKRFVCTSSRLFSSLSSCKNSPSREIFLTLHPFPTPASIMDTRKLFISSIFIETLHWPGFWSIGREETPLQACRSKAGAPVAAAFSTRSSYFSACRQASRYRLAWKHIVLAPSTLHLWSTSVHLCLNRATREFNVWILSIQVSEKDQDGDEFFEQTRREDPDHELEMYTYFQPSCPRSFFARIPIFPAKDLSNLEGLFSLFCF